MNAGEPVTGLDADELDALMYSAPYREAGIRFLVIFQAALAHCLQAATPEIGMLQVRYALGLVDESMRDNAARLGITAAGISKGAKQFVRENNLPMPACMKSEEASNHYRDVRNNQLK